MMSRSVGRWLQSSPFMDDGHQRRPCRRPCTGAREVHGVASQSSKTRRLSRSVCGEGRRSVKHPRIGCKHVLCKCQGGVCAWRNAEQTHSSSNNKATASSRLRRRRRPPAAADAGGGVERRLGACASDPAGLQGSVRSIRPRFSLEAMVSFALWR